MGQSLSQEEINNRASSVFSTFSENFNNVGIDESLLTYSGMDSAAKLEDFSFQLLSEVGSNIPDYLEKLGSALVDVSAVPNSVGIGALIISIILQICFIATKGHQSLGPSTVDLLRRIFAEEKSSEVRDLMEEYLKRYRMHLRDDHLLIVETTRLEQELSFQLTRLKNSMLLEGHMNSRALKQWANGAAFHAQMLIHVARLKKKQGSGLNSARDAAYSAINTYEKDLSHLLERYKAFRISNLDCFIYAGWVCRITDKETGEKHYYGYEGYCYVSSEDLINYMFTRDRRIIELKSYFSDLQKNVDVLISQQGTFKFQKS
ncbi:hypothetical protein P4O66_002008 [Electrophorus voltai]|uniref:Uncharacterized protein n=1 Tax=Electrophorus voltai TaxID=2609070 RepID=A0AAD8ZV57_9TELE|nr:hypothetical protein P4O66_002008 [Electrophorus voltai]